MKNEKRRRNERRPHCKGMKNEKERGKKNEIGRGNER